MPTHVLPMPRCAHSCSLHTHTCPPCAQVCHLMPTCAYPVPTPCPRVPIPHPGVPTPCLHLPTPCPGVPTLCPRVPTACPLGLTAEARWAEAAVGSGRVGQGQAAAPVQTGSAWAGGVVPTLPHAPAPHEAVRQVNLLPVDGHLSVGGTPSEVTSVPPAQDRGGFRRGWGRVSPLRCSPGRWRWLGGAGGVRCPPGTGECGG